MSFIHFCIVTTSHSGMFWDLAFLLKDKCRFSVWYSYWLYRWRNC